MTVTHLAQVKALGGLDAVARVILIELADEADSNGRCAPPLKALARAAQVSENTVRARLGLLERGGYLVRERRRDANGAPAPTLIRLTLAARAGRTSFSSTVEPPPPSNFEPPPPSNFEPPPPSTVEPPPANSEGGSRAGDI